MIHCVNIATWRRRRCWGMIGTGVDLDDDKPLVDAVGIYWSRAVVFYRSWE